MDLIIQAHLSEPPSSLSCFRDVTLYAKTFVFDDILLRCPPGTRSLYWSWLKSKGAHDFISYLIKDSEFASGVLISSQNANLNVSRIDYSNLDFLISFLNSFQKP